MLRPCFLVVDREQFGSISTRKLVIETAKFNVITAYSYAEAMEALERFPNVDGVVLDAAIKNGSCTELVATMKQLRPEMPIIVVGSSERHPCESPTMHLETFDPKQLLDVLKQLNPERAADIEQRERAGQAQ